MRGDETPRAGLYARVSSDHQTKDGTVASQIEALRQRIDEDGLACEEELCFIDDGYIGVDEIQFQKGHRYLTVVYQIDQGCRRLL